MQAPPLPDTARHRVMPGGIGMLLRRAAYYLRATTAASRLRCLVTVVVRLERTVLVNANVASLLVRQHGQVRTDARQMQTRDLLVEMLRQHIHLVLVLRAFGEQFD